LRAHAISLESKFIETPARGGWLCHKKEKRNRKKNYTKSNLTYTVVLILVIE